jgi:transcriptional regulator with XRE-family HTH domain
MPHSLMVSNESPAVARRRLRLALRRAREARGYTQLQVAEALEWSLSKVNRIEGGEVTISHTDLRALLQLLEVTDQELIGRLTDDARASRQRRGWWDNPELREHLTPATRQLLQFESQARAIRTFQSTLFPGLFQTREYADVVFSFWTQPHPGAPPGDQADGQRYWLTDSERDARIQVRLHRAGHVFERPDPPEYLLILDESVIFRVLGGPSVMAQQLAEVLRLGENPRITVRIVPFAQAAPIALLGPFTIFDLGEEEGSVLYREGPERDEIVQSPHEVSRHRHIFEQMWEAAWDPGATARLIRERMAIMLASPDRERGHGSPANGL